MADPTKKPDRLKPFKRINNASSIPNDPPSGDGVACGCHVPNEFPNIDAEFARFMKNEGGGLGAFADVLKKAKEIAKGLSKVTDIAKDVAKAAALVMAAFAALGGPAAPFIALIGTIVVFTAVVDKIMAFIDKVLDTVDVAIREFLARIGANLAKRAIRRIPQWVPVQDAANKQKITREQIREVEGIVAHSYCDPLGTPFYQWQHWLSWSIQVKPEDDYRKLVVPKFQFARSKDMLAEESPLVDTQTIELQWDMGGLRVGSDEPGVYGVAFNEKKTQEELIRREAPFLQSGELAPDRRHNWLWPTAGMFVWASGRWVYDCSRPDSLTSPRPLMYAMLNPLRALATASWEAFGFQENAGGTNPQRNAVPAIRFMFIASRHGGYLESPSLADEDYEFILDLPPLPVPTLPFAIGHTNAQKRTAEEAPDFPHATVVLRPRLLFDLARPQSVAVPMKLAKPIVELLPGSDEAGTVRQVKITVRADDLSNASTGEGHAGFLLSLGWHDPDNVRANTVKRFTVNYAELQGRLKRQRDDVVAMLKGLFQEELDKVKQAVKDKIEESIAIKLLPGTPEITIQRMIDNTLEPERLRSLVRDIGLGLRSLVRTIVDTVFEKTIELISAIVEELTTEEWMVHMGVNGRWTTRFLDLEKNEKQPLVPPASIEVFLGPDDMLFQSTSGVQWNPVGEILRRPKEDRMLKLKNTGAVDWSQIARASGDELRSLMFRYALDVLVGPGGKLILGVENDPLGLREPSGLGSGNEDNPIRAGAIDLGEKRIRTEPLPRFARAAGKEEVLAVQDPKTEDYRLSGNIEVGKQFPQ